jgi:multicomponent Na+:H+ antiporter subunit G
MIADIAIYLGSALLLLGALFSLIAAIGVLRLPDLYTRMHAASKAGAVGGGLILSLLL